MSKFQKVMEYLHPRVVLAKTEIAHDNIRAAFRLQSSTVGSYEEFEKVVITYVNHHENAFKGAAPLHHMPGPSLPL